MKISKQLGFSCLLAVAGIMVSGSAQGQHPCGPGTGSRSDSFNFAAASELGLSDLIDGASALHPDAGCAAMGQAEPARLMALNPPVSLADCKEQFRTAFRRGFAVDATTEGARCSALGSWAGSATLHYYARTGNSKASSSCRSQYRRGFEDYGSGTTSGGTSDNVEAACYRFGYWDASEGGGSTAHLQTDATTGERVEAIAPGNGTIHTLAPGGQ